MKIDCLNKHIVLVGNSVDSLTKKQGRDIDSFDLVVRFGKGVPTGKEKLRAANKKGDHLLLDQKNVKDKSNYICNKECRYKNSL